MVDQSYSGKILYVNILQFYSRERIIKEAHRTKVQKDGSLDIENIKVESGYNIIVVRDNNTIDEWDELIQYIQNNFSKKDGRIKCIKYLKEFHNKICLSTIQFKILYGGYHPPSAITQYLSSFITYEELLQILHVNLDFNDPNLVEFSINGITKKTHIHYGDSFPESINNRYLTFIEDSNFDTTNDEYLLSLYQKRHLFYYAKSSIIKYFKDTNSSVLSRRFWNVNSQIKDYLSPIEHESNRVTTTRGRLAKGQVNYDAPIKGKTNEGKTRSLIDKVSYIITQNGESDKIQKSELKIIRNAIEILTPLQSYYMDLYFNKGMSYRAIEKLTGTCNGACSIMNNISCRKIGLYIQIMRRIKESTDENGSLDWYKFFENCPFIWSTLEGLIINTLLDDINQELDLDKLIHLFCGKYSGDGIKREVPKYTKTYMKNTIERIKVKLLFFRLDPEELNDIHQLFSICKDYDEVEDKPTYFSLQILKQYNIFYKKK